MIVLNKPLQPDLDKLNQYLQRINECGWYTNFGPLHEELTKRLEDYLGVDNLLLVANGTLAIQVAAKVLKVKSAITTPFSFVATSSALLWQGVELKYCDIDPHTLNLCPKEVERALSEGSEHQAIVATHVYGSPCDVEAFDAIAEKFDKKLIYDAAHAFGVELNGQSILNHGDASTLSFHATKLFHTVEGGAIRFKHREDYLRAKELINFGIQPGGELGEPGINAKLNEYQCAVGLVLLDKIDEVLSHRRNLIEWYRSGLSDFVKLQSWDKNSKKNGSYMPIVFKDRKTRDIIKCKLEENKIESRVYFKPSLDTGYKSQTQGEAEISNDIVNKILCLPLHHYMSEGDIKFITDVISVELNSI